MRRLCVAIFFLTACSTASAPVAEVSHSPAQASPTSSPTSSPISSPTSAPSATAAPTSPAAPVLGVFYDSTGTTLAILDSNARVVASINVGAPHRYNRGLPWVSSTSTRVYFVDTTGTVSYLARDGSTGVAAHVTVGAGQEAGIAVSPDDLKIAVALLSYRSPSSFAGTAIYVEDLAGGGHHADIYSSSVNAEFPIGWTAGRLVLALSTPFCCPAAALNPYGALEYHVVDASTGRRLVTLCHGTSGPTGPPVAVGVSCVTPQPPPQSYFHWDGTSCCAVGTAGVGAISPDGNAEAWSNPNGIFISFGPDSSNVASIVGNGIPGDVLGWLDSGHLVYSVRSTGVLYIGAMPSLDGPAIPLHGPTTTFAGTIPAAIS